MAKYTASRLSGGNHAFPDQITTDPESLTVKIPGLFGGKSQNFPYTQISSVSVNSPVVGYSSITFYAADTKVSANGFTKSETEKIKREIEAGRTNYGRSGGGKFGGDGKSEEEMEHEQELAAIQAEASKSADRVRADHEIRQANAKDKLERPWAYDDNFSWESSITKIVFPEDTANTVKTIEKIISLKRKELKDFIEKEIKFNAGEYIKFMVYGWLFKITDIIQAFAGTPKICTSVRPSMDKIQEGLKKLKQSGERSDWSSLEKEVDSLDELLREIPMKVKSTTLTKIVLTVVFWIVCILSTVKWK